VRALSLSNANTTLEAVFDGTTDREREREREIKRDRER
jgi:hypothetical protein